LASCFYNHIELDLRNGFFREEEVFVWALYKYTIKTQEICLQISALLGERVYVVKKKAILVSVKTWHTVNFVIPIFQSLPVPFMMLNDLPRGPLMLLL
jgi:hypothetical protein